MELTNENVESLYLRIHSALKGYCLDYLLVPEFADMRLHFHGVVKFKTRWQLETFMSRTHMHILRKIGQTHVDGVPKPKWIQYMFKEYEITRNMMFEYAIIERRDDYVPPNIMTQLINYEDDYLLDNIEEIQDASVRVGKTEEKDNDETEEPEEGSEDSERDLELSQISSSEGNQQTI